jgi:hypothetical protein
MGVEKVDPEMVAKEADRRLLHSALAGIGSAGSPLLKEIADDLRAGRVTLGDLARRPELAESFKEAAARYQRWTEGLTGGERAVLLAEMERRVQRMREKVAEELAAKESKES